MHCLPECAENVVIDRGINDNELRVYVTKRPEIDLLAVSTNNYDRIIYGKIKVKVDKLDIRKNIYCLKLGEGEGDNQDLIKSGIDLNNKNKGVCQSMEGVVGIDLTDEEVCQSVAHSKLSKI